MNRRHFIQLSGASLAALLTADVTKASGNPTMVLSLPDAVSILLDKEYISLQSSDHQTWEYKDVTIELKANTGAVSIFIQSPTLLLKEVQLRWQHATSKDAIVAGDAWERTYGNIAWQPVASESKRLPWYCVARNGNNTFCFGVKTGCNAFCSWQITSTNLQLNVDIRNGGSGVNLGNRKLKAADIISGKNKEGETVFATVHRFCKEMCNAPRKVAQPVYGINDWYFAYGKNSAELILKHTALLAPLATDVHNRPFSVVDDGWETGNDFSKPNEKFGDMQKLTNEIKKLGMCPGLWTRPLIAKPDTKKSLFLPNFQNDNKDDGAVLDPSIDENIESIKSNIRLYKQWGFEMIKHDYSTFDIFGKWGFDMNGKMTEEGWHLADTSKTNAEIILHLYQALREAAGDMYLIGCNTVSHLSAGLFELNRIGDDTSGKEWSRTKKMGVNTMGFRMVQHKAFYEADGDCVGLTTAIPWDKNKQWMQLLAQSSAPLFISAQPDAVGAEQKAFIKQCFTDAAKVQPIGEPQDWLTNPFPSDWKLDGKIVHFDW